MTKTVKTTLTRQQAKALLKEFFALERSQDPFKEQKIADFLERNDDPSFLKLIQLRNRLLLNLHPEAFKELDD